jgi:hypothetical protein
MDFLHLRQNYVTHPFLQSEGGLEFTKEDLLLTAKNGVITLGAHDHKELERS